MSTRKERGIRRKEKRNGNAGELCKRYVRKKRKRPLLMGEVQANDDARKSKGSAKDPPKTRSEIRGETQRICCTRSSSQWKEKGRGRETLLPVEIEKKKLQLSKAGSGEIIDQSFTEAVNARRKKEELIQDKVGVKESEWRKSEMRRQKFSIRERHGGQSEKKLEGNIAQPVRDNLAKKTTERENE